MNIIVLNIKIVSETDSRLHNAVGFSVWFNRWVRQMNSADSFYRNSVVDCSDTVGFLRSPGSQCDQLEIPYQSHAWQDSQ